MYVIYQNAFLSSVPLTYLCKYLLNQVKTQIIFYKRKGGAETNLVSELIVPK